MLGIGRGLMSNAKLLMVDEPALGLAPVLVQEIGSMMAEGEDPFSWDLFTMERLLPIVQSRIGGRQLASRTLSAALRKLGAVPLDQVRLNARLLPGITRRTAPGL